MNEIPKQTGIAATPFLKYLEEALNSAASFCRSARVYFSSAWCQDVTASLSAIWRPHMTQNLVFRASAAAFDPGDGFQDLFDNRDRHDRYYSILLNAILTF